jgi:hypothetical protein
MAETYPYEILIRGAAGGRLGIKGCHFIECTVVNGKDYPGDPVPIHLADLDGLLPEWFTGLAGQIAEAEAARDAGLLEIKDRDERISEMADHTVGLQNLLADREGHIGSLAAANTALEQRLAAQLAANATLAATNVALEERIAKLLAAS